MLFKERTIIQMDADELVENLEKMFDKKMDDLLEKINKKEVIYTREEAGNFLGVSPNTITKLINTGVLRNKGLGRKILVSSLDIERAMERKRISIKV